MQYPIIDNLIYAYQRNGWTGNSLIFEQGGISDATGAEVVSDVRNRSDFIKIHELNTFVFNNGIQNIRIRYLYFYDTTLNYLGRSSTRTNFPNTVSIPNDLYEEIPINAEYIRIVITKTPDNTIRPNEYLITSNGSFEDNFSHRFKLPMIHYFPHPVIDAIISAADGQHTEEEKEILRHYLTPLGIGGI